MQLLLFLILMIEISCGRGNISVNRQAETVEEQKTTSPGSNPSPEPPKPQQNPNDTFKTQVFSVLIKERPGFQKGCATSGCHLVNNAASNGATFYQVDPQNAEESLKWAAVRRNKVQEGQFAGVSGQTLKEKAGQSPKHNTFKDWTAEEFSILNQWSDLP